MYLRAEALKRPQALFEYLPPQADDWEVPRARLVTGDVIGEGEYGKVMIGHVTGACRVAGVVAMCADAMDDDDDDVVMHRRDP